MEDQNPKPINQEEMKRRFLQRLMDPHFVEELIVRLKGPIVDEPSEDRN